MARSDNQKLKLLYLMKIFYEYSDDKHPLSVEDIINHLNEYDITVERKTVYSDVDMLIEFGMDIIKDRQGSKGLYYLCSRDFELAELKMLVDSVQVSKFITPQKTRELISKIEGLTSKYEGVCLNRQVYVAEQIKSLNKLMFNNIDVIHNSIAENRCIKFKYFMWDTDKKQVLRNNGEFYNVSPWLLVLSDENYYLVAYDNEAGRIKHFRVDKMLKTEMCDERRKGKTAFNNINMSTYSNKMFNMYEGENASVDFICENSAIGIMIDRFGNDIPVVKVDDDHFKTVVKVSASDAFYGWVVGLGGKIKIAGPANVRAKFDELIAKFK